MANLLRTVAKPKIITEPFQRRIWTGYFCKAKLLKLSQRERFKFVIPQSGSVSYFCTVILPFRIRIWKADIISHYARKPDTQQILWKTRSRRYWRCFSQKTGGPPEKEPRDKPGTSSREASSSSKTEADLESGKSEATSVLNDTSTSSWLGWIRSTTSSLKRAASGQTKSYDSANPDTKTSQSITEGVGKVKSKPAAKEFGKQVERKTDVDHNLAGAVINPAEVKLHSKQGKDVDKDTQSESIKISNKQAKKTAELKHELSGATVGVAQVKLNPNKYDKYTEKDIDKQYDKDIVEGGAKLYGEQVEKTAKLNHEVTGATVSVEQFKLNPNTYDKDINREFRKEYGQDVVKDGDKLYGEQVEKTAEIKNDLTGATVGAAQVKLHPNKVAKETDTKSGNQGPTGDVKHNLTGAAVGIAEVKLHPKYQPHKIHDLGSLSPEELLREFTGKLTKKEARRLKDIEQADDSGFAKRIHRFRLEQIKRNARRNQPGNRDYSKDREDPTKEL